MKATEIKKWRLETDNCGCDEEGLEGTYDEVLCDVLHHHDIDELPATWELVECETGIETG